jgi:NDP-4-keto-2,6-dideoxyhexose 3-C-methyltransferase
MCQPYITLIRASLTSIASRASDRIRVMKCLACNAPTQGPVALMGNQEPSAIFNSEITQGLMKSSLDLTICTSADCRLVQLFEPVDLDFVYKNYPYRSGKTATMKEQLYQVIQFGLSGVKLNQGDIILDIGGNDGTLLSHFKESNYRLANFDIAAGVEQVFSNQNYFYVNHEFTADRYKRVFEDKPRLIFCTAVFYQIRKLQEFCQDLSSIMDKETILVLQFTYLETMYSKNIFDNVVHEHLTYFSLYSLKNLLLKFGLTITEAEIVSTYGGSLRVKIQKFTWSSEFPTVNHILSTEHDRGTNTVERLRWFGVNFETWITTFKRFYFLNNFHKARVFGLGASTKGNMLLQAVGFGIDQIECIWDNSSEKIGLFTTGTNIPIKSEDFTNELPDAFLILPYYYYSAFKSIIASNLPPGKTIKLITPLPHPKFEEIVAHA